MSSGIFGLILTLPVIFIQVVAQQPPPKPNLVIIVADDMGFNDVGFHGSNQIATPNIDALAVYGIILNRYYVSPICSPSRVSLMTGKYSTTVGMQHYVITTNQPFGLGLKEKLLPEYLKEAGYNTHIVGKWHLGTHQHFEDSIRTLGSLGWKGYDMRKNLDPYRETIGTYATDLFTQESIKIIQSHNTENPLFLYIPYTTPHVANDYDPLQAPQEILDKFSYIKDLKRRKYTAMVSVLDDSVGKVVNALGAKEMLDNTVILFFCDNGAPTEGLYSNSGSNHPLRGQKNSPWDGAVRSAGAIWSPLLQSRERTSNQLFHISDWLPTFAALAGVTIDTPLDGKNIWPALSYNLNSPRKDVLLHLDDIDNYQSYINGDYKYVRGTTINGTYDHWLGSVDLSENHPMFQNYGDAIISSPVGQAVAKYSLSNLTSLAVETHRQTSIITCNNVEIPTEKSLQCFPLAGPCLFNITDDPCERKNIAGLRPVILDMMEREVNQFRIKSLSGAV